MIVNWLYSLSKGVLDSSCQIAIAVSQAEAEKDIRYCTNDRLTANAYILHTECLMILHTECLILY